MPALFTSMVTGPQASSVSATDLLPGLLVGDVEGDGASRVADVGRHACGLVVEHVGQHDRGALGHEQAGLGLALAPGRPGDDGDLARRAVRALRACPRPTTHMAKNCEPPP